MKMESFKKNNTNKSMIRELERRIKKLESSINRLVDNLSFKLESEILEYGHVPDEKFEELKAKYDCLTQGRELSLYFEEYSCDVNLSIWWEPDRSSCTCAIHDIAVSNTNNELIQSIFAKYVSTLDYFDENKTKIGDLIHKLVYFSKDVNEFNAQITDFIKEVKLYGLEFSSFCEDDYE